MQWIFPNALILITLQHSKNPPDHKNRRKWELLKTGLKKKVMHWQPK